MRHLLRTAAFILVLLPLEILGWFKSGAPAPSSPRTPSRSSAQAGPPPHFSVVPLDRQREGLTQIASLQAAAGTETFLDKMLGTNCYSRAVSDLERDCSRLDQLQKSRLALGLANCQLATQGQDTFPCSNTETLRACVDRLPDRENFMYIEFLTHVDSMCLFIQNQQFEKHTEMLLNTLSEGAGFAKEQLSAMGAKAQELSQDTAAIRAVAIDTVARLKEQKDLQIEAIDVVKQHRAETTARLNELAVQQTEALHLAERQLEVGKQVSEATEGVERRIISGQTQLESMFGILGEKAVALVQAQDLAAQVQHDLGEQLKSLSDGSKGLRNAVDTVAEYQRRSDAALIKLLGRSYTLEDAVFYGAGVVAAMAAGASKATEGARLPVFGLLGVNILAERMLLDKLHLWLDVDSAGEIVLTIPTPSWLPTGQGSVFSALEKPLTVNFRSSLRRGCALLCAGVLLVTILSYRDWERASYLRLEQINEEIRKMNTRHENLVKQYQDELLQARRVAIAPKSGTGDLGGGRGRPAGTRAAVAHPPPPFTVQYLLSNEDQVADDEPHGLGSQIDYSSDDQAALVPWMLSPDQVAEHQIPKQSKRKGRLAMHTIDEEAELTESQEITRPPKSKTARGSKRAPSNNSDGSREVRPTTGQITRARGGEASDLRIEDTSKTSQGRAKAPSAKIPSRKRALTESTDGGPPSAKKKQK
ncbi:hypothetical protein Ndes2526B_g07161 [Nannochloris sp. 'desiccata']|nr:putative Protein GAMETE EXPRESSED 1 [Chlorella desiccata (nom. nud.)]